MTQFLVHAAPVTARPSVRTLSLLLTAVLAVLGAAGCGDPEQPIVGPDICTGSSCDAVGPDGTAGDADVGAEVDIQADTLPQRLVNFYAETKNGNVLQGSVSTATIQIGDDKYPDIKGTQVDFVLQTTNVPNGATVQVTLAGQALAVSPPVTVQNGTARIEKVSIPCTTQAIAIGVKVVVAAGDEGSSAKSLRLNCDNACTASIDPYDACLTTDVDPATPGFQATFVVRTTTTDCTHAFLVVTDTTGAASQSTKVALAGAASAPITVTLAPSASGLQDASASITASVEDQDNDGRPTGASATEQLTISTEPPALTLTGPTKEQLLLADDVSPATAGIQVLLTGTVTGLGAAGIGAVAVSIDGGDPIQATVLAGGIWQAPLSFTANKTYTVSVEATSSCGLSSSKSAVYSVYVTTATLGFVAPASGSTLLAVDDGNATTDLAYETTLTVSVQNGTLDATVSVLCKNGAGALVPVGSAVIKDPAAATLAVPVSFNTAVLGSAVSCQLIDNAPNPATSASAQWTVALPAPCLSVADPVTPDVVVTTASLPISLVANHLTGRTVTARIRAFGSDTALSVVELGALNAGGLTTDLALAADGNNLPDGVYLIDFAASDGFGNQAALSLCSDPTRTVTLDTTGPALALHLPNKPTLTTFDDPDANTSLFGYQAILAFGITDAAEVCVDLAGDVTCVATLPTDTTATFTTVSLQPGDNVFSAFARDVNGNVTTAGPFSVLLISDVPVVKFIQPVKSMVTASDTLEVIVAVNAPDGHTLTAVELDVLINGLPVDATVTDLGNGQYSFALSGLSATTTTSLQVGAFALGAEDKVGYSSALTITYKSVLPGIAVTAPFNGQTISLASPSCAVGQTNCVRTVTAKTTDVEDGSPASLSIVCGLADPVTLTATVQNATASFPGAVLPNGDTCVLTASVVDAAGQSAVSAPNTVTIDRVAPVVGDIVAPSGKTGSSVLFLAISDADQDPLNGMQVSLSIQVGGVSAGAAVSLLVTDDNGGQTVWPATSVTGSADGSFGLASFGLIALPDGFAVQLEVTATDAAGNQGKRVISAQVQSASPEVRILSPATNNAECSALAPCGTGSVCRAGRCHAAVGINTAKQVGFQVIGLPVGGTIRVCTDTPGTATVLGPCATSGYSILAETQLIVQTGSIPFAIPDGDYHLILEAGLLPQVAYTTSLTASSAGSRERYMAQDTVAPTVTVLTAPAGGGVPANCLADALQSTTDLNQPGGSFAFSLQTSEPGSVTLRSNGTIVGSGVMTGSVSAILATLVQEGNTVISATPVDDMGNVGPVSSLPSLVVNTVPPSGQFSSPAKSPLIVGDSLSVTLASVDLDVEGVTATVADATVDKASAPFVGGLADFPNAQFGLLSQGTHNLTATIRDTCNNSSVVATSPAVVEVDIIPPVAAIVAPAESVVFGDADDASPLGGYQIGAVFSTEGGVSWQLSLASGCDSGFGDCTSNQIMASGAITNAGGVEPTKLVTVPFGDSPFYLLRVVVTDASGNTTTVDRGFKVQLTGCLVSLKGLAASGIYNTQSCPTAGQNCASVSPELTVEFVGPCGEVSGVRFVKGGTPLQTVVPVDSKATLVVTIADGESTTIEAEVLEGPTVMASSGQTSVKADLTKPGLTFVAGTVLGVDTPAGSTAYTVGKSKDRDGTAAGHQIHALLQVTDTGLAGGKLTSLQRTIGGTTTTLSVSAPTIPQAFAAATASVPLQFATLQPDTQNVLTATAEDAAGNVQSTTLTVYVDWTAPAAVALETLTDGDLVARLPSATLRFDAVGDDGTTGTASSYEVRYSRSPIADTTAFEAACDASLLLGTTLTAPKASGDAETQVVAGPDERNYDDVCKFVPQVDNGVGKYYFAVRAVDDAGNKGAISNVVETSKLALQFAQIKPTTPAPFTVNQANDMRSRVAAVGDLNGDGRGDLAVGGGANSPLCIVYGRAGTGDIVLDALESTGTDTATTPGHICLPVAEANGVPVARVGDVNGDGIDDIAVGTNSNGTLGAAYRKAKIFLGVKNGKISATPAVVLDNVGTSTPPGVSRLAGAGNFNGDKTGGSPALPIGDIVIRSSSSSANDQLFVIPGSTTWSASSPITIDLNSGTSRNTNNVATIRLLDQTSFSGTIFGNALGSVGDLLTDTVGSFDDLYIAMYAEPQQVVLLKGRSWTGATDIVLSKLSAGTGSDDSMAVRIASSTFSINNFGASFVRANVDGDAVTDLVLTHQSVLSGATAGAIFVVRGAEIIKLALGTLNYMIPDGPQETGTPAIYLHNLGYAVGGWARTIFNIGDFFGRAGGAEDYLVSRLSGSEDGGATKTSIWMGLDRNVSLAAAPTAPYLIDLLFGNIFAPTANFSSTQAALGDFNGDGRPDLAFPVGTPSTGVLLVF